MCDNIVERPHSEALDQFCCQNDGNTKEIKTNLVDIETLRKVLKRN